MNRKAIITISSIPTGAFLIYWEKWSSFIILLLSVGLLYIGLKK